MLSSSPEGWTQLSAPNQQEPLGSPAIPKCWILADSCNSNIPSDKGGSAHAETVMGALQAGPAFPGLQRSWRGLFPSSTLPHSHWPGIYSFNLEMLHPQFSLLLKMPITPLDVKLQDLLQV